MGLLDGKVAIVTGAGFGIGRAHALELASHGAAVLVNDLGTSLEGRGADQSPAEHVAQLIRERGGRAAANFEDVADWDGAARMIQQAVDEFGHLDTLVTNAAIFRDRAMHELSEDDWDSVVRVHLKGTAAPVHHAIVYWKNERAAGRRRPASIVTTTSRAGLIPSRAQAVRPSYVAAKAAVAALTQVLSFDLYEDGIRVNSLSPSAYTRNAALVFDKGPVTEAGEDGGSAPFDPFGPGTNSPLVVYLASDLSRHVTGQVFRMHYGSEIFQMTPWQYGARIATQDGWEPEAIATALDTQVFGSRLPWPLESEEQQRTFVSERRGPAPS